MGSPQYSFSFNFFEAACSCVWTGLYGTRTACRPSNLYHSGFRALVHCSTLADANEGRDWSVYPDFSQRLIAQARPRRHGSMALGR